MTPPYSLLPMGRGIVGARHAQFGLRLTEASAVPLHYVAVPPSVRTYQVRAVAAEVPAAMNAATIATTSSHDSTLIVPDLPRATQLALPRQRGPRDEIQIVVARLPAKCRANLVCYRDERG